MKQGFQQPRLMLVRVATIAVALGIVATQGLAQAERPGLFKQNPQKRDEPIKITSATLEVRDKQKLATFTGDVHAIQGENDLRCAVLVIYYDNEQEGKKGGKQGGKAAAPAASGERGNQKIRRMEAKGSVIMTQKDQRAVGDHADFDVPNNVMVMTGDVIVTRGEDIIRGRRLHVNMTTGIYRMESDGGRVDVLLKSKSGQPQTPPRPGRSN